MLEEEIINMPTTIYHRTWCKRCLDFTLHLWTKIDDSKTLICKDCKQEENGYSFNEVPEEKLLEQRERYKKSKFSQLEKITNMYLNSNSSLFNDMMKEPGNDIKIIECDAGQKYIDNKRHEAYEKAKQERNEMINDYNQNYSKLNRNDKCSCGSNKKFKVCCLPKFKEKGIAN